MALFNGLSQWIQCMVLSKTTPQQRATVIVKFANVAKVRARHTSVDNYLQALSTRAPHTHRTRPTILVRLCIHSFSSDWQIPAEVDCMAQRFTFCQEQRLNLENVVSSAPVQPPETLYHLTFTTLLASVQSENDSRMYFLIVLTTDYLLYGAPGRFVYRRPTNFVC